jgi:2-polyprenyl-3-methyl-5-hydroxy-6-metoxy-1,4-benzoquinol methylase
MNSLRDLCVLDIGSGWGEFLSVLQEEGSLIYGVEPDRRLVDVSNKMLGCTCVKQGFAEALPFEKNTFDLVICHDVLEHVKNHDIAISQLIRVTKPGGYIWLEIPNYAYPEESHYKIFFPPGVPKSLGSLYLRLIGRDTRFYLDSINPTYYGRLKKTLSLYDVVISEVQDELYGRKSGLIKSHLKRIYMKYFGPPIVAMIIGKN